MFKDRSYYDEYYLNNLNYYRTQFAQPQIGSVTYVPPYISPNPLPPLEVKDPADLLLPFQRQTEPYNVRNSNSPYQDINGVLSPFKPDYLNVFNNGRNFFTNLNNSSNFRAGLKATSNFNSCRCPFRDCPCRNKNVNRTNCPNRVKCANCPNVNCPCRVENFTGWQCGCVNGICTVSESFIGVGNTLDSQIQNGNSSILNNQPNFAEMQDANELNQLWGGYGAGNESFYATSTAMTPNLRPTSYDILAYYNK